MPREVEFLLDCCFFDKASMNTEKELSPEMNSALQALALSEYQGGNGAQCDQSPRATRRTFPKESLTPSRLCRGSGSEGARRVAGRDSQRRDGPSDSGFSPVPSYISDRLRKLGCSPMRLRDYPPCLKNSRLS